jgi:hypothetical protein
VELVQLRQNTKKKESGIENSQWREREKGGEGGGRKTERNKSTSK